MKLILVSLEHNANWTISEALAISSKVQEDEKFEKKINCFNLLNET